MLGIILLLYLNTVNAKKTIYMFGDSTMQRFQFPVICEMVAAARIPTPSPFKMCRSSNFTIVSTKQYSSWGTSLFENDIIDVAMKSTHTVPDFVYFNGGLHYLHLMPVRDWDNSLNNFKGYFNWKNAENIVNNFVNQNKQHNLIYMTSHSICENKFHSVYRDAVQAIEQNPEQIAKKCYNSTNSLNDCMNGTFNRAGVQRLNARVLSVLGDVDVVDAFSITDNQCAHTNDGRHYSQNLVKEEVQELLKIVQERISP